MELMFAFLVVCLLGGGYFIYLDSFSDEEIKEQTIKTYCEDFCERPAVKVQYEDALECRKECFNKSWEDE